MINKLLLPEVQKFIKDHQSDDPFLLSLKVKKGTPFSLPGRPGNGDFPLKESVEQVQSFQKAKAKIPLWIEKENIIWPPPVSVEQSSSEITAKFKSTLIHGDSMIDLTGGMGVDSYFFASTFRRIDFVEADQYLCEVARHNFSVLGKENISIKNSKAEEFISDYPRKADAIYIDPSRRSEGRKVFKMEDCSPNVLEIVPKCRNISNQILLKLSPLVDLSMLIREFQPAVIWIVAIKNEVKEILCLILNATSTTRIHAVDLDMNSAVRSEFKFYHHQEIESKSDFSLPLKYLYEPNAAILKTGAFKLIGRHYNVKKLHQHTHLYTSDEMVDNFPGKVFVVKNQVKGGKKEIALLFPDRQVNVITRNYSLSATQLKQKFGLQDGGDNFLIGTTLMNSAKVLLLCMRL